MAIGTEKRTLTELNANETLALTHAMTAVSTEFVMNIFRIAKIANVKEHELMETAAFSMNTSKDDPVFWEKIAPQIVDEINAEDEEG